jgi:hypothetical protein
VRNCELLKKFYEEQNELIQIVDNLVQDSEKFTTGRNELSGNFGRIEYRLLCNSYWVELKILVQGSFVFVYSSDYETDNWECSEFLGTDVIAGINFGNVMNDDSFNVHDGNTQKKMSYPIMEEQYFQYLTIFDLSSEELYEYFLNIKKERQCVLQLMSSNSDGMQKFNEIISDKDDMKELQSKIKMIDYTLRKTMGI